ncbi:hypothetical protein HK405_002083, partial [Cladochytrium tenue]
MTVKNALELAAVGCKASGTSARRLCIDKRRTRSRTRSRTRNRVCYLDTLSTVVALAKTSESSRRGSLPSAAPASGNPTRKSLAAPAATFKGLDRYGQVVGVNSGMIGDTE